MTRTFCPTARRQNPRRHEANEIAWGQPSEKVTTATDRLKGAK